jgi:hypothetical protein
MLYAYDICCCALHSDDVHNKQTSRPKIYKNSQRTNIETLVTVPYNFLPLCIRVRTSCMAGVSAYGKTRVSCKKINYKLSHKCLFIQDLSLH